MSLSLSFRAFLRQLVLVHGDNTPREVGHLLKRRLAVRFWRVGRLHTLHTIREIK